MTGAGQPAAREQAGARIDGLFADVASVRPGRTAVVDATDGRELTYAELAARAVGVAEALAARGVGRGDFVGVALGRSADMIVAVLGVLTAGAAYVPLDSSYPAGQLAEMISRSGVKLVIGDPLPGQRVPVISLPADAGPPPAAHAAATINVTAGSAADGGDPAYVMFTSGSTGQPKAVVVPHRAVVRLVRGADFAVMTDAERWLHAAAPAFDGATLELWAPLLNGAPWSSCPACRVWPGWLRRSAGTRSPPPSSPPACSTWSWTPTCRRCAAAPARHRRRGGLGPHLCGGRCRWSARSSTATARPRTPPSPPATG